MRCMHCGTVVRTDLEVRAERCRRCKAREARRCTDNEADHQWHLPPLARVRPRGARMTDHHMRGLPFGDGPAETREAT